MKRIVVAVLGWIGLLACLALPAQTLEPAGPRMETLRGEQPIVLRALAISARMRGGLAETTVRMEFYNPNRRPLEGNLDFPLLDGQQVTGFALDFDGKLRDAVAVEKARGRQVFEAIERVNVDPALLEKTQGNNFRLRVYPVPAKGVRTVEVRYSEALPRQGETRRYRLPLAYGEQLERFSLRLDSDAAGAPASSGTLGPLDFTARGGLFVAQVQRAQFVARGEVEILLPTARKPQVAVERRDDGAFFVAEVPVPAARASRRLPSRLQLLWDSSLSGAARDHAGELALLDGYFRAIGDAEVRLQRLRDRPEPVQAFRVRKGDWSALRRELEGTRYDGASALAAWQPDAGAQEVLLVSDGLLNYGGLQFATLAPGVRLYALNSAASADRDRLRALADASGGRLLELRPGHAAESLQDLLADAPRVIALSGEGLADLQAAPGGGRDGFVRVAGRLLSPQARLALRFSGGEQLEVPIGADAPDSPFAAREWAGYRIAGLAAEPELHRAEIARLGLRFGLATSETSLIVLDRVEDYVRYEIAPPPELAKAYATLREERQAEEGKERSSHLEEVVKAFQDKVAWWEKDYPKGEMPPPPKPKPGSGLGSIAGHTTPNAAVVIESVAGDFRRELTADADGNYRAGSLPQGEYRVTSRGQTRTVNVSVGGEPASTLDTMAVAVTGGAIDVAAPESTTILSAEQIARIPVPRDVTSVALLAPGTVRGRATAADDEDEDGTVRPAATIQIAARPWQSDAPYLARLRAAPDDALYAIYLDLRADYLATPGFFVDVAELLQSRGQQALALRVLSNLAELGIDQRPLLRVLGYRLLQWNEPALAIPVFQAVLRNAEYEPQSFRDLGLAYAAAGREQEAVDALAEVVLRPWDDRFAEIELISLADLNALVARAQQPLDTHRLDPRLLRNLPLDLRVVLNWDADDSDVDLWVTDPNGEKCYYGFKNTYQGGRMSDDFTQGYGPEEFSLRVAKKGHYKVEVNYYSNRQQSVVGPTTVQVRLQTHFGTPAVQERILGLRLKQDSKTMLVGEFDVE